MLEFKELKEENKLLFWDMELPEKFFTKMEATLSVYGNEVSTDYDKELGLSAFVYVDPSQVSSEKYIDNEIKRFEDFYNEALKRIKKGELY